MDSFLNVVLWNSDKLWMGAWGAVWGVLSLKRLQTTGLGICVVTDLCH